MGILESELLGGAIAALGGALLFGALPRIMHKPRAGNSTIFAIGLAILANSRPFEGLIVSLLPTARLVIWLVRGKDLALEVRLFKVALPILVVVATTAGMMGYYNWRVTGDPVKFPYFVHKDTYMMAPLFAFQSESGPKVYNHQRLRNFHTGWELEPYLRQQTFLGVMGEAGKKLGVLWGFYVGPLLSLPLLIALRFTWRNRRMRLPLLACALMIAAFLPLNWVLPHYSAPITCLMVLFLVQALRQARLWSWHGRAIGRQFAYGIPAAFFASLVVTAAIQVRYSNAGWSAERARLLRELNRLPGRHLILVQYDARETDSHVEWVFNDADIDNAKVVWARDTDSGNRRQLLRYFEDREVWLLVYQEQKLIRFDKLPKSHLAIN